MSNNVRIKNNYAVLKGEVISMQKNKGFTLIELLAVIIILAVIALIATPVVLNVVDNAKSSARQNSISGYADATKLAVYDTMYLEDGKIPVIDKDWALANVKKQGSDINCEKVIYSENYGVVLHNCTVDNDKTAYYFAAGKVYTDPENAEYKAIYETTLAPKDYVDASGASKPELTDKLIPVIYEGGSWKVADKTQKWYDYNNKEWANAVVLNSGVTKTTGQTLDLNADVAMMYVWIPRYEYKIPEESKGTTGAPKSIDIKFIDSSKTTATVGYSIHPGFTFNNKNQNGIWMGKFETTTTDATCLATSNTTNCNKVQTIKVLPNTDSLRYITVSNMFNSSRQAQTDYNLTGLDIHMSKYTEWTAVSYLTNSKYGRCTGDTCAEVTINNYYKNSSTYNTLTGCAGASVSASSSTTCSYTYEKPQGQLASTTGNIYGVYDMSGGTWEYVMGVAKTSTGKTMSDYSGFSTATSNSQYDKLPEKKYYDEFALGGLNNYRYSDIISYNGTTNFAGILGELQIDKTTSPSWFGDYAASVSSGDPWFRLGGGWGDATFAGVFASSYSNGDTYGNYGFRVVLSAEE